MMARPAHLRAKRGDIAQIVIASGDQARTEQLKRLLRKPRVVNANRGFITFTGYYGEKMVTLATHGIGGPSASIVFEELRMLGAKVVVRFGTTGALVRSLNVGHFVVPTAALYLDRRPDSHGRMGISSALPDFGLMDNIIRRCAVEKVRYKEGPVFSSDSFYHEDTSNLEHSIKRGAVGVEMECATLFTLGKLRGFSAAALLIVSNSLLRATSGGLATAERLARHVERGGRILLDTLTEGDIF